MESNYNILREKYNPDGSKLRQLQLRMLEILIVIDTICKRYDIKYWLSSGTLLGAVRHRGFIPWDDDLDIEMMREDYMRFIQIAPKELPKQFVLQTADNDPNYIYISAKVRDTKSYVKDKLEVNRTLRYQGAFVDVFCLEPSWRWCRKLSVPLFNCFTWRFVLKTGILRWVYDVLRIIIVNGIYPIMRLFSRLAPKNILYHTFGVFFHTPRYAEELFPLSEIEFEGFNFPCPQNYDAYLKRLYGEYMKVPETIEAHIVDNTIDIY